MSIAVLNQVYSETRRLSIAGSPLACGDFRLKKLIEPLRTAGKKAAVFGKVADAVEKLVEGPEKDSAQAMLELSTLVTAILYTQGKTGTDGKLKPIDTTDMGIHSTQAAARVLKPLLEALTTTGSGRQEIIEDAHRRGAFNDLRLVKPAVGAIDDVYGEIADFVTDKVLPLYGKAILPEIKATFDPKGKGGHVRRLRLMYQLDPEGTLPVAREVLDSGSKELKVAALECLSGSKDDVSYLLEQATARAKDVRRAALRALSGFKEDTVVDTLMKAVSGADIEIAAEPVSRNRSPKLLKFLFAEADTQLGGLFTTKDKAKLKKQLACFHQLLSCFATRTDKKTEEFLLGCFEQRDKLAKLKGDISGEDVSLKAAQLLVAMDSKKVQKILIDSHSTLAPDVLQLAFVAAARTKKPKEVYRYFSPYLSARASGKKSRDPAKQKYEAIREVLLIRPEEYASYYEYYHEGHAALLKGAEWAPEWLDAAVKADDLPLVLTLARPKHKAAEKYLQRTVEKKLKKSGSNDYEIDNILETMIRIGHPKSADILVEALRKLSKSRSYGYYYGYWLGRLIPELPKKDAPKIEALLASLPDKAVDNLVPYLTELKNKS